MGHIFKQIHKGKKDPRPGHLERRQNELRYNCICVFEIVNTSFCSKEELLIISRAVMIHPHALMSTEESERVRGRGNFSPHAPLNVDIFSQGDDLKITKFDVSGLNKNSKDDQNSSFSR